MQEQRTAHVLVAVAADDGGSPAALPPLPLLLSSVQLLAEAIEHARRAAAVKANIASGGGARRGGGEGGGDGGEGGGEGGAGGAGDGGGGVPRHHRLRAAPSRCSASAEAAAGRAREVRHAAGCGARGVGMQMPRGERRVPKRRCIEMPPTRHTGGQWLYTVRYLAFSKYSAASTGAAVREPRVQVG